jgi:class 3 adenylate cyclase
VPASRPTALLRSPEGAFLALLLAVLTVAVGLYVREELRGGPWRSQVIVAPVGGRAAAPRVVAFAPGYDASASRLRKGDRLLRVGPRPLRGAQPWEVYAALYAEASRQGEVELEFERAGRRFTASERLAALPNAWRDVALGLSFAVTALVLLRRAPHSRMIRSFTASALAWAVAQVQFPGEAPGQTYAYFVVRSLAGCLWGPLAILAAVHFPEGAWPAERRSPRWPWLFAVLGLTWTGFFMGVPFPTAFAMRANPAVGSLVLASMLVVATRNYALAGPLGRRQVKWVLLGCYLAFVPSFFGSLVGAVRPDLTWLWFASQVALVALPLSIFIAVTRSNLLDIDRLLSGTASFTLLMVVLGAGALQVVPWIAGEASKRAGIDASLVQTALAVGVAFAIVRLEPRLRPHVERLFFAERQAFQSGIDQLVADVAKAPDTSSIAALVGAHLDALIGPEFCVIYARGSAAYAPIFSRRCAITPHFEIDSTLLRALAERAAAVDLERDRSVPARASPADRAALAGLDAAVLVPAVRDQSLLGFVALGRKSSGDIYTSTDLALLGLVGGSVSASIARFDDEEVLREARALQEKLRQYVPASIAERLAEGRDLEPGERAISVLFADLRGYTSLVERLAAEEIFRIVSVYTEAVTRVVAQHGGTVVEFNGDGMMAVFGAPDPLPDKERRALAAAREIVSEVSGLRGLDPTRRVAVGVGLATGVAYVGAIRSVDRHIWSAIGNPTNLAARLQALSRDLDAPIVIDDETHRAACDEASDFERRPATPIRGLRAPRDVFVLAHASVQAL